LILYILYKLAKLSAFWLARLLFIIYTAVMRNLYNFRLRLTVQTHCFWYEWTEEVLDAPLMTATLPGDIANG
jgi:hypothetical protein